MLKYHGYKTQNNSNEVADNDVLLIINPVSGGGNARKATPEVIQQFERRNRIVEVYCTYIYFLDNLNLNLALV